MGGLPAFRAEATRAIHLAAAAPVAPTLAAFARS
jgi:hypothetical protein